MPHNEGEITDARSRGSNLGLNSIRSQRPKSGVLGFQGKIGAAEGLEKGGAALVTGSAEPEK